MNGAESPATRAASLGKEFERNYHGCGQCTLAAIQDTLGIRDDAVFKAASAFGGGIAKFGDGSCGAYLAGALMFGLLFGRSRAGFEGDKEELNRVYRLMTAYREDFLKRYHSIACEGVQTSIFGRSFNIWDPDDKKKFEEMGAHTSKCPGVVGHASALAVDLILKELEKMGLQPDAVVPPTDQKEGPDTGSSGRIPR